MLSEHRVIEHSGFYYGTGRWREGRAHPTQTEHLLCARPHSKCFQSFVTQQVFIVQLLCAGHHGNSYSFSMYILNIHYAPGSFSHWAHSHEWHRCILILVKPKGGETDNGGKKKIT